MAAGLLRKKAISEQWRLEVRGEVVREWVERGRGGDRCVCGAVVVLAEMACTGRLPAFGGVKEGGGSSFLGCAGGGGCQRLEQCYHS